MNKFVPSDYNKGRERFNSRRQRMVNQEGVWRPEEGRNRFRILPPPSKKDGEKWDQNYWAVQYGVHYNLGSDDSEISSTTCPKVTLGRPCPICKFIRTLWNKRDADSVALAKRIGCRTRYASNVLVYEHPNAPKVWYYPKTAFDQMDEVCYSDPNEPVKIDDPATGYNFNVSVSIRSTEEGSFPQYIVTPELKQSPLPDLKIIEKTINLAEMIYNRVRTYDEIQAILLSSGGEDNVKAPKDSPASDVRHSDESSDEVIEEDVAPSGSGAQASEAESAPAPLSREDIIKRAKQAMNAKKTQ